MVGVVIIVIRNFKIIGNITIMVMVVNEVEEDFVVLVMENFKVIIVKASFILIKVKPVVVKNGNHSV